MPRCPSVGAWVALVEADRGQSQWSWWLSSRQRQASEVGRLAAIAKV
jgi:hypothetical protein